MSHDTCSVYIILILVVLNTTKLHTLNVFVLLFCHGTCVLELMRTAKIPVG